MCSSSGNVFHHVHLSTNQNTCSGWRFHIDSLRQCILGVGVAVARRFLRRSCRCNRDDNRRYNGPCVYFSRSEDFCFEIVYWFDCGSNRPQIQENQRVQRQKIHRKMVCHIVKRCDVVQCFRRPICGLFLQIIRPRSTSGICKGARQNQRRRDVFQRNSDGYRGEHFVCGNSPNIKKTRFIKLKKASDFALTLFACIS